MSARHPYRYKRLPGPDFTRILTVHPAPRHRSVIVCNIEPAIIHDSSDYDALSYSWAMHDGDASLCRSLIIDGMVKPVTRNLYEALRRLRYPRGPKLRLWIDAVCINQTDSIELASQVMRMDEIFSNATHVYAWLGEPRSQLEGRNVLNWLSAALCECDWTCGSTRHYWEFEDGTVLNLCADYYEYQVKRRWQIESVVKDCLLMARYWTRQWIVQELAFANTARTFVVWGSLGHSLPVVARALKAVVDGKYGQQIKRGLGTGFAATLRDRTMLLKNVATKDLQLHDWLDQCSELECADPRDKLFSLLSLDRAITLLPDYSTSIARIYTAFAADLVRRGHSELLFDNLPGADVATSTPPYLCRNLDRRNTDLPSWVPDLRLPFKSNDAWLDGIDRIKARVHGNSIIYEAYFLGICTKLRHSTESGIWFPPHPIRCGPEFPDGVDMASGYTAWMGSREFEVQHPALKGDEVYLLPQLAYPRGNPGIVHFLRAVPDRPGEYRFVQAGNIDFQRIVPELLYAQKQTLITLV